MHVYESEGVRIPTVFVSNPYIVGITTLSLNTAANAVKLQVANNPGSHYKVLGTTADGTQLYLLLLQGFDATKSLSTK